METLWFILLIPLVVVLAARVVLHTTITWPEAALNVAVAVGLTFAVWQGGRYSEMHDYEILNGEVTGKHRDMVSCEHSYSCNCRQSCTGSGQNRSCSTVCDTCYEHAFDYDWMVDSNVGSFEITRIDRQGALQPPRWAAVRNGEPVAMHHGYTNYVRAARESLFHDEASFVAQFAGMIPEYPIGIYDYHRLDRVIAVGVGVPDLAEWNKDLSQRLRLIGPQRQANVVIVIVNTPDPNYVYALRAAWMGFKKNDIVVAIGVTDAPKIAWAAAMSWSKKDMVNIVLRDEIMNVGTIDRTAILNTIDKAVMAHFERRPMAEFEYLKDSIEPPTWAVVLAIIVALLSSIGLTVVFHKHDVFGTRRPVTFNRF